MGNFTIYFDRLGNQRGPYSDKSIKARAKAGTITPDTVIKTEDGKQYYAKGMVGIEFETDTPKDTTNNGAEHLALKAQLLNLESQVRTQRQVKHTTVGDIVMALIIFFIGIPILILFLMVATCR